MITCPMCKKTVRGEVRECPTCRTDLGILLDYLSDLDGSLQKAEARTRAGQLGEAVWAYLEVLEVDPDNREARRQIGTVVTAVRQFDEVMPGRRWHSRLRKQAKIRKLKEDIQDLTPRGWLIVFGGIVLLAVALVGGYFWGWTDGRAPAPEPPATQPADTRPAIDKNKKLDLKLPPKDRL